MPALQSFTVTNVAAGPSFVKGYATLPWCLLMALGFAAGWQVSHSPVYLYVVLMFHFNGWGHPWVMTILGATIVFTRTLAPDNFFAAIREHSVTQFGAAPMVLQMLAEAEGKDDTQFDPPTNVLTAGAPPPPSVLKKTRAIEFEVMQAGQCYYLPIVDVTERMLNDSVAVKLADDRWWVSIADSDLLYWVKGLAYGERLDVLVDEPDVSPLAVQGPRTENSMAALFGDVVRKVRFFRFGTFDFQGRSLVVAHSGYSKLGGFEIYVEGSDIGMPLWNALIEAGKDLDVYAGGSNLIERNEGGLLSYGNEMTDDNTPHECGLGKFCNIQAAIGCVERDALLRVTNDGPVQQIRPIAVEGKSVQPAATIGCCWRVAKRLDGYLRLLRRPISIQTFRSEWCA